MESFAPKIASLGDIQIIIENLERYPIPKLDESVVSMLNDALSMLEQNNQGSNVVVGLQLVVSVIDRSVQKSFEHSEADWDTIATSLIMLFRQILKFMIFNSLFSNSEQGVRVIHTATETLLTLGNNTPTMRCLLMEHNGIQILQLICWEDLDFAVRKKMLFRFKKLLMKLSAAQRAVLLNTTAFPKSSLVKMLPSCGDYEFQEYLTEILVRFAMSLRGWKKVFKSWFSDFPPVVDAVETLDPKSYEISCRKFLNLVNESQSTNSRVHSLPCVYAAVSRQIELKKPAGYDELWIDCSPRTGDIQLLVDEGAGSWARVTVEFASIQSIKCGCRKWRCPGGKVESCHQLVIDVHPSIVIPFETTVPFSQLIVLLKKDIRFQELENNFFKVIYAHYYKSERANQVVQQARKTTPRAITSFITTSSSRKTSLANVTLSTIEKVPSRFMSGSCASVEKWSRLSTSVIPNMSKQIISSTPVKSNGPDARGIQRATRKVVKGNVETETFEDRKEFEKTDVITSSVSTRQRTSVSHQVTLTARRDVDEADREKLLQIFSNSQCSPLRVENALLNPRESSDESFLDLAEEVTHERRSPSNGHILLEVSADSAGHLEAISTNEEIIPLNDREEAQTTVSRPGSPIVVDSRCDTIFNKVAEVVDLTAPPLEGLRHGVFQDSILANTNKFSVPGTPASQSVFGTHHASLVDFKALQPPPPLDRPSLPEMCPSSLPFKKKFFSNFRKPRGDISESEASLSSCSTKISKRHFSGIVQIRSPSLSLGKSVERSVTMKTCGDPVDPFSFVDDDERVVEDMKDKFRTPATKERQKRKLYTPGKDDVLHSNDRDSPSRFSDGKNHKLPSKCNRSLKGKCIMDMSNDESKGKMTVYRKVCENQMAEENATRRSTRRKKIVSYKDASSSESGVSFLKPRVPDKLIKRPSSREVERIRSERVASSSPTPSGSAPNIVSVDLVAVSPPCCSVIACEFEPVQISPPPQVQMVLSPVKPKMIKKGTKRKNENADVKNEVKKRNKNKKCIPDTEVPSTMLSEAIVPEAHQEQVIVAPSDIPIETATSGIETNMKNVVKNPDKAMNSNVLCVGSPNKAVPQFEENTPSRPDKAHALCSTSSSTDQPVHLMDSITLKRNGEKSVSVEASSMSQVQFGFGDSYLQGRIDAVTDQIWSKVKTYVNGIKSENTPIVESIEVNLSTCLATHKAVMNTIQEESLNIVRSAANVQSACEKGMASFDVVLEMLKVIEDLHRESTIAASVRSNDPRTYSQLRQQIYKLINETLGQKPCEE